MKLQDKHKAGKKDNKSWLKRATGICSSLDVGWASKNKVGMGKSDTTSLLDYPYH